jgi:ribonuclease Z
MVKVYILGSGYAVAEEGHEHTHLLIEHEERRILVDCATCPIIRLKSLGMRFDSVTDLVLTHFHPDHVAGLPVFLIESWLLGRKAALHIYGLDHTIERAEIMMGLYDWKKWPNFYPVIFHRMPDFEMSLLMGTGNLNIYSSPVKHLIPTIGLRFEDRHTGRNLAYSCDTEPCQAVEDLARGADILIHEATGQSIGHSSAAQAAQVARQAEAKRLYLIHYSHENKGEEKMLADARQIFGPKVELAVDGLIIDL